jgi:DNA-binding protein HU-beta
MNKGDLIARMAKDARVSKAAAEKSIDSFCDAVTATLKKGGKVTLVGFGTFSTARRKARVGRNPATGQVIKIAAATVPKFSPGKALKDTVRGKKK